MRNQPLAQIFERIKMKEKKRGLIAGYKPNRISLYILLLSCDRLDELSDVLYKDMQKYKEEDNETN